MLFISVIVAAFLSVLSTTIMLYVATATGIGPWIAPTLALCGILVMQISKGYLSSAGAAYATGAGSIGGILATAVGFSYPTLYFLDKELFMHWLDKPVPFCLALSGLSLGAGAVGLWTADVLSHQLIEEDQLPFPIGKMICKILGVQGRVKQAYELAAGFGGAALFSLLQDGVGVWKGFIPKNIVLSATKTAGVFVIPSITLMIWPFLWAVGFVTGYVIALPLAVGALVRYGVMDPLARAFFPLLTPEEFSVGFCSGIVFFGMVTAFSALFSTLPQFTRHHMEGVRQEGLFTRISDWVKGVVSRYTRMQWLALGAVIAINTLFLSLMHFSFLSQWYLLLFSYVCSYQIAVIAGKIGLAQLGRFATFVMVPALLLFNLSHMQIVFIATFVEIAGGVAADALFGRRVVYDCVLDESRMRLFQLLGLVISSLCVGILFWLFATHLQLGSAQLYAPRAQPRALMIIAHTFNYYALLLGMMMGYALKRLSLNPMLVLGGILMPVSNSIGLITGGIIALCVHNAESWYPFWSGVSASNALWMVLKVFI